MGQDFSRHDGGCCLYGSRVYCYACSQNPPAILALYIIASLLSFLMYAADKAAARKGASRTPENILHLLSLAGGWPGARVAQQNFRHKTRKQPFRSIFWITILLNTGTFVWLLTPAGSPALLSLVPG
jgi:uncharacterized membrane protein YsdA (DUF1294 family)